MDHETAATQPPVLDQTFPTDPSGLPEATRPEVLDLADGDTLNLRVAPVAKGLRESTVRMLGYNGSIPGPTLRVRQGTEVIVNVTNDGDLDTTVHWHGRAVVLHGDFLHCSLSRHALSVTGRFAPVDSPGCQSPARS